MLTWLVLLGLARLLGDDLSRWSAARRSRSRAGDRVAAFAARLRGRVRRAVDGVPALLLLAVFLVFGGGSSRRC
jgi:type II secretory pathway component PulM